jgi:hypothetical protein
MAEMKGKKRDLSALTLEQKLTLIHGRTDGRLESLKEINWKLGQYLEDRTNVQPDIQRLMELKKIGTNLGVQEIEGQRKRRELERGKVPRRMKRKDLPKGDGDLKQLYNEISKRYQGYQQDIQPISKKLKEVLSEEIQEESKGLWLQSKTHAVTLKELNKLEDSSNLKAINDEETKLLDVIMGREEVKPVVKQAPRRKRKKEIVIPPPNLKPYIGMVIGGAVAAGVGGAMFLYLFMMAGSFSMEGFLSLAGIGLVLAPIIVGIVLIIVGALKRSSKMQEYAEAKRRAEIEAVEEEEAPPEEEEE